MHLSRFVATIALISLTLPPAASGAQRQKEPVGRRPAAPPAEAAQIVPGNANADDTRNRLEELLRQYPPSVGRVLSLDPTLLDDATYLQTYPELSTFLAAHPEVRHNPTYYFGNYEQNFRNLVPTYRLTPQDRAIDMWNRAIQGFTIGAVLITVAAGLFWLLKTMIEYRRWSRVSKVHTEVHSKLLDRFTSNEDLLAYIQTPVGRKFLESAPIPLDSPRSISAPVGRILWSAQVGAVLTVLGLGIEVVARNVVDELAGPVGAIGAVIIALGVGFLLSAVLAYVLSRRFGLMNEPAAPETRG